MISNKANMKFKRSNILYQPKTVIYIYRTKMIVKNGLTFSLKMCPTILKEKKEQHYCLCPQKKVFQETFYAPSNETDVNMIGIIRQKAKEMSVQNLVTKTNLTCRVRIHIFRIHKYNYQYLKVH